MVLVTCGMLEGCEAPLEAADTEVSSGELTSKSWEETESLEAFCPPDAASTQRMKSSLPPADGAPPRSIPAPYSFVNFQGRLYFVALGNDPGLTLWRSDGTPAGTVAVKTFPGLKSLTPSSSRLFFRAVDAAHGEEPWVSDGTTAGTRLLKDLTPGVEGSSLVDMTALGERLVFFRQVKDPNTSTTSSELWTSDGTTPGTVRLRAALPEVIPSSGGGFGGPVPSEVLKLGGALLFITRDANGLALWRTDGTKAGTARLKDVGAAGTGVYSTRMSGGWAFFYVKGTDGTTAVWKSDGTKAGTQRLHTYDSTLSPLMLGALGSSLYVTTTSPTTQRIVVRRIPLAGGSETPVVTLPNEYADQGSAYPYVTGVSAVEGGKKLYFALTISGERQAPRDAQLWVTDGTAAGTLMLHRPLSRSDEYTSPLYAAADDLVFFSADGENTTGIEPWVTDGTPAGARLLKDLVPGGESSYPYGFLRVGPRVFISTADIIDGGQVWATHLRTTCSTSASP
ncbi:ELWxxDGT repeat protein [Melittangium boletus]|uniref:ELWxxDGT repeat protein n=1 Tax=Melittangium boletus TaxID=83453 RepID=UPI001FE27020|nr:ELWxxDGT repeat protein [Melittangium boletus]